jgi:FKBP-type peptidyl-prolyl cis-trans isomerase (trigger factor)
LRQEHQDQLNKQIDQKHTIDVPETAIKQEKRLEAMEKEHQAKVSDYEVTLQIMREARDTWAGTSIDLKKELDEKTRENSEWMDRFTSKKDKKRTR